MMRNHHRGTWRGATGLFLFLLGAACLAGLQDFGTVRNFKHPEYYDPPHQSQLKTLLSGALAEPAPGGCVRITDLHVDTFRETGEREMIVDAPECIYDPATRQASSAGPIKAHSADDRVTIQGTGFLLVVTNRSITISNNVHTVLRNVGSLSDFHLNP
jgi:hypothetical protein